MKILIVALLAVFGPAPDPSQTHMACPRLVAFSPKWESDALVLEALIADEATSLAGIDTVLSTVADGRYHGDGTAARREVVCVCQALVADLHTLSKPARQHLRKWISTRAGTP